MGQSISQLYVHLVFHIAYNSPKIQGEDINRLYHYINNYTDSLRCPILAIGGMPDHIHILLNLGKDLAISEFVRNIKANTSRWLKTINPHYRLFSWQNGYGAFSVSPSGIERTIKYIRNQHEHHRYRTMEEEIKWLLECCNNHISKIKWLCRSYGAQNVVETINPGLAPWAMKKCRPFRALLRFTTNQLFCCFHALALACPQVGAYRVSYYSYLCKDLILGML